MDFQTDLYGTALLDYHRNLYTEDLTVCSPTMEDDILPLPYLFRSYNEMPTLEKKALQLVKGKTLDVGAGAGIHSVYVQEQGYDVTALDQSEKACEVLTDRLENSRVICDTVWNHQEKYDTILILMNGTGIFGTLDQATVKLDHLKTLLLSKGQILIDSSDLKFLFEDEEDGGLWVDSSKKYYGEISFSLKYKGQESQEFDWLYMDFPLLERCASASGLHAELVMKGDHHDYLARLTLE